MVTEITEKEYILLRDFIHKESGISLARLRREIILSRLSRRLRDLGIASFIEYYQLVMKDVSEFMRLIDRISTHVTQFFREPGQFEYLCSTVIPEIIGSGGDKVRIWSAGCSSGEEPYTISICIHETLKHHRCGSMDIKILATDISPVVLKKAADGVYSGESVASVPEHLLKRYFMTGTGKHNGLFKIKQAVKEPMVYRVVNLTEGSYPIRGMFDAVFCRNVIIYFDKATQTRVTENMLRLLKPGGYLFCGHSESMIGMRDRLRVVNPCVYRKEC